MMMQDMMTRTRSTPTRHVRGILQKIFTVSSLCNQWVNQSVSGMWNLEGRRFKISLVLPFPLCARRDNFLIHVLFKLS
jgi:hypothetical protein